MFRHLDQTFTHVNENRTATREGRIMGQAEKAQDNFWYLIGFAGDVVLRVRPGMRLGVNAEGELSFMSSNAQIHMDLAEDGGLIVSAAAEHELVSLDGTLQSEPLLCHSRTEIHLLGSSLQVDRDFSVEAEPDVVLEVRALELPNESGIRPDKQKLEEALDSLLKPWPEPAGKSSDEKVTTPAAEPRQESPPADLVAVTSGQPAPKSEPEQQQNLQPKSEPEPQQNLQPKQKPKPKPKPKPKQKRKPQQKRKSQQKSKPRQNQPPQQKSQPQQNQPPQQTQPPQRFNKQPITGAREVDDRAPGGLRIRKRWLLPISAGLVVIALWLIATLVADSLAPSPAKSTEALERSLDLAPAVTNQADDSTNAGRIERPAQTNETSTLAATVAEATSPQRVVSEQASEPARALPQSETAIVPPAQGAATEDPLSEPDLGSSRSAAIASRQSTDTISLPEIIEVPEVEPEVQSTVVNQDPPIAAAESPEPESTRTNSPAAVVPRTTDRGRSIEEPRRILLLADRALAQGRLVEPPEANAYQLYSRVRELDPELEEAVVGLQAVRQGLINRALAQLATGELPGAKQSLIAAAETGANPIMVADLRNEVEYQIRMADAQAGQFESLYPFNELVVVAQQAPRISGIADLEEEFSVGVEFTVTTTGEVSDIEVLNEVPDEVDLAVRDALSDWQFEPVMFNRRPIPVRSSLSILLPN